MLLAGGLSARALLLLHDPPILRHWYYAPFTADYDSSSPAATQDSTGFSGHQSLPSEQTVAMRRHRTSHSAGIRACATTRSEQQRNLAALNQQTGLLACFLPWLAS